MLMAVPPTPRRFPMAALTVPFLVIGIALTAPVYAFGVRRLLGLRLPLRPSQVVGSK